MMIRGISGLLAIGFGFLLCGAQIAVANSIIFEPSGGVQQTNNCLPFGCPDSYPIADFLYANVPAFSLAPGDKIKFDIYQTVNFDLEYDIFMSDNDSLSNNTSANFTQIVDDATASTPRGNSIFGDYDLEFTVSAPFSFAGGDLTIRTAFTGTADGSFTYNLSGIANASTDSNFAGRRRVSDATQGLGTLDLSTAVPSFQIEIADIPAPASFGLGLLALAPLVFSGHAHLRNRKTRQSDGRA